MRRSFAVVFVLFSLWLTGCASKPEIQETHLEQRADYSEEYITNRQGLKLFARTWETSKPVRANILVLHGTALHGGIYQPVAKKLNDAGFRIFALDMQSWGRSQGVAGRGYVESFDDYVKDVFEVLNILRIRYPNTPNFILGENIGATVAIYGVLKENLWVDGIIAESIAYKPRPAFLGIRTPGFLSSIALTTANLWGKSAPKAPVMDGDVSLRMVVENDALQRYILHDPYVTHGMLPAAYVSTLVSAMDYTERNLADFKLPLLMLQGSDDLLVPVSSSQEVFNRVSSDAKEIRIYDSPHLILLERAADQAIADIEAFLDRTLKKTVVKPEEKGVAF